MTIDELKNRNKIYKYSKYPHYYQSVAMSKSDSAISMIFSILTSSSLSGRFYAVRPAK